jgi:hypothetical protein
MITSTATADRVLIRGFGGPRPTIITLCGSTRFHDEFRQQNLRLTIAGHAVLSIGCDTKSDDDLFGVQDAEQLKDRLDRLHLRKIDLADEILVLNVGGYIGDSTRKEIAYALGRGKTVRYLEPVDVYPVDAQEVETACNPRAWLVDMWAQVETARLLGDRDVLSQIIWDCQLALGVTLVYEPDAATTRRLTRIALVEADQVYDSPTGEDLTRQAQQAAEVGDLAKLAEIGNQAAEAVRQSAYERADVDTLARLAGTAVAELGTYPPAWVQWPELTF